LNLKSLLDFAAALAGLLIAIVRISEPYVKQNI
jgi:hypothetical protein